MVTLRGFPAYCEFLGRHLPPVRHVTAVSAVELRRNVVVAAWASTSVVRLGFHCVGPLLQICLRNLSAVNIALILAIAFFWTVAYWRLTAIKMPVRRQPESKWATRKH